MWDATQTNLFLINFRCKSALARLLGNGTHDHHFPSDDETHTYPLDSAHKRHCRSLECTSPPRKIGELYGLSFDGSQSAEAS